MGKQGTSWGSRPAGMAQLASLSRAFISPTSGSSTEPVAGHPAVLVMGTDKARRLWEREGFLLTPALLGHAFCFCGKIPLFLFRLGP